MLPFTRSNKMDDLKHVDFVARGVMLDSHIEDAIKEISMQYKVSADHIFNDYKFYKPAILLCNSLYHFITVKFISDMGSKILIKVRSHIYRV